MIIAGFPGIGKTYLLSISSQISDSDSSQFSWLDQSKRIRHPDWPKNYIEHIKANTSKHIMVSSHAEVRRALVEAGLAFTLVYPLEDQKAEYCDRYEKRGSPVSFIQLVQANFEQWIAELRKQTGCNHVVLRPGEFLADVLTMIEATA